MGIKFWKFHMIPWCFHHIQCLQFHPEPPVETITLIRYDGFVKIYYQPINVSDLLIQFPKHLVCGSDSFYIGQKIPPLAEDYQLQLGHKYFLLPKHFFQQVLSFVTIASIYRDSRNVLINKAPTVQPFDLQKTPSGCLRIRMSDEFISQLMMKQGKINEDNDDDAHRSRLCTTAQLQKDYRKLVGSQQWKPKLETIKEKEKRKLSSLGMRNNKKSLLKIKMISQRLDKHLHVTSIKPLAKACRVRTKSRK